MSTPNTRPIAFYGYPAELIAEWCGVSIKTARLYKAGQRKPSLQALRLFTLHRDGKVLGRAWRDFTVQGDYLVDSAGRRSRASQLMAWNLLLQWMAGIASRDPQVQRQYYEILRDVG